MSSTHCRIALTMLPGLGPKGIRRLLSHFDNDADAFFRTRDLQQLPGINESNRRFVLDGTALRKAEEEMRFIEKHAIETCFFGEANYPSRLMNCDDAPFLLYKKGTAHLDAPRVLAVVGTRRMTAYGRDRVEELVSALASALPDVVVVSGLAYGVDICAHRASLKSKLSTVAVLAHGLDRIYPAAHSSEAKELLEQGALLTEMPSGTRPLPSLFVQRNRIVAGLCDACVVVESAERGGSLITARLARDYNREVFAFPGRSIDNHSLGCNKLIKQHIAALIDEASDLFQEMNWHLPQQPTLPFEAPAVAPKPLPDGPIGKLYTLFEPGQDYSTEGLLASHQQQWPEDAMSIGTMVALLMQLEMTGLVVSLPGSRYRLK